MLTSAQDSESVVSDVKISANQDQRTVQGAPSSGGSGGGKFRSLRWSSATLEVLAFSIVPVSVVCAFSKSVLGGLPVSRLYQLGQRDSLFSQYYSGVREGYDASVYQYFVPNHIYTAKSWLQGHIPLWNPLTGCGAPHLADIETAVLWPLRLILLSVEPIRAWNLLIVLNLVVYGAGTYVLARTLGVSRIPAVLAGLVLAFCPYLIFQSELIGGCASLTPWVMAAFTCCALSPKLVWRATAALACALMVISGHPEPVFFGISVACILRLCLAMFLNPGKDNGRTEDKSSDAISPDSSTGSASLPRRLSLAIGDIAITGLLSVGLTSIVLAPFVELLLNSECYKLGLDGWNFGAPLNTVLVNLLHPAYGNCSPWLGVVVPVMLVFALFAGVKRPVIAGALTAFFVAIVVMCRPGPLENLLTFKALSWFVPKYCWPSVLVLSAVVAAFGLESFLVGGRQRDEESSGGSNTPLSPSEMRTSRQSSKVLIAGFLSSILIVGLSLVACRYCPSLLQSRPMDEAFDHLVVQNKAFIRDLILLGVLFCGASCVALPRRFRLVAGVVVVAICGVISLGPIVKGASPLRPVIRYDSVEPVPFLQQCDSRIVTMGRHVFCPDSNLAYSVANIVPVNVYHPTRFQTFMKKCGVTHEGVNQFFDGRAGRFLDLASVEYAVSPLPVLGSDDRMLPLQALPPQSRPSWQLHLVPSPSISSSEAPASPTPGSRSSNAESASITLESGSMELFVDNSDIVGRLEFSVPGAIASELAWQPVLLDSKKQVIWFGDLERLKYMFAAKSGADRIRCTKDVVVAVPRKLPAHEKVILGVQLFDWRSNSYVDSTTSPFNEKDRKSLVPVAEFTPGGSDTGAVPGLRVGIGVPGSRHYKLLSESDARIRVYRNMRALPKAYFVPSVQLACDAQDALDKMEESSFDPSSSAVIERGATDASPTAGSTTASWTSDAATSTDQTVTGTAEMGTIAGNLTSKKQGPVIPQDSPRGAARAAHSCAVLRPDCNSVDIECNADAPGVVVLTDTFYPGWHARVTQGGVSRDVPILRANYLFRAVEVPAGKSRIEFSFMPQSFVWGAAASLVSLLVTVAVVLRGLHGTITLNTHAAARVRSNSQGK